MYEIQDTELVLCFQPRSVDPPHFIAENEEQLYERRGEIVGGEQCDSCGNSAYRIKERIANPIAR